MYAKILLNVEIRIFQRNFVSLWVDMKNLLTKCAAIVLVLWYSLSVIGFDVHTCNGSGKAFIATIISGTGCDDIHPEHDTPSCKCCQKAGADQEDSCDASLRTKPCCTDDWQVISLTGVRAMKDKVLEDYICDMQFSFNPALVHDTCENLNLNSNISRIFYRLLPGSVAIRSCQEAYGVWRI